MNNKCAAHVKGLLPRANNIAPSLSNNGCSVHTAMHGARARARATSYGCTVHSSMRRTLFAWSNHFRYMHGDFLLRKSTFTFFVLSIHRPDIVFEYALYFVRGTVKMHARCSEVCAEQPVLTSILNYAQNNFIDNPGTV